MKAENQEQTVAELEKLLERLHALYNQYFMGIEKIEPLIPRKEVERKIQVLRKEQIRNTAVRFRFQTQLQKYNTQSTYWRRVCRQIEEGTYQRDVMRAKKRTERQDEAAVAENALSQLGEEPMAQGASDLSAEMGMDLDDPFAEGSKKLEPRPDPLASLDDPFSLAPDGPAPSVEHDPDKTPVPAVSSGIHKLHEKMIDDAKIDEDSVERESATELESFFSRKSIPPPPPTDAGQSAPPPPRARAASAPRPRPAAAKRRPANAPKSPPPAPQKGGVDGLGDDRMKAIYRAYSSARKKTDEPGVSFDKVSKLLKKQLAAKSDVKDFKVVIRGGKAVIKTVKD